MKKSKFICFTILILGWIVLFLPQNIMAQSLAQDQTQILQECFEIPNVQKLVEINSDNQIFIMQHSVNFTESLDFTNYGKEVVFMSKPEIYSNKIDVFFLFEKFEISQTSASISYILFYDYNTAFKEKIVMLELQKTGGLWSILSTKLERR